MKNFNKIFILMVVISVITSAFVISASADSTVYYSVEIKDTITNFTNGKRVDVNWSSINDVSGDNIRIEVTSSGVFINFYEGSTNRLYLKYDKDGNLKADQPYQGYMDNLTIEYNSDNSSHSILNSWFTIIIPPCDGSTCPATDVNLDNVCDDCGLTFSMLREFTPSDFPSGYPSVPSVASDARYYLYTVHSSVHTYIVVYPSTVTPTYDTTKQNGYLTFSESYGSYRLDTTNNEWVLNNDDSPYSIGGTNNNSVDVLYSSVPIKDQNGENFFPIPLWEKVEKVTQGEIPQFSQTLGGNLMTLTLCGVGCLTLLMALVLLSKTFRTYLPR